MTTLTIGEIKADLIKKDIKNLHLSVYPPTGRVRISAPRRMNTDSIRAFVCSKMRWIKKQQAKFDGQQRETPREFIDRESHYFMGERYLLKVVEHNQPPQVSIGCGQIELRVRAGSGASKRQEVVEGWCRERLRDKVGELLPKWEKQIGVSLKEFGIKKMKTRWGTCNAKAGRIWLNFELVKKPVECIEYVLVHELVHLIEKGHGDKFKSLIDKHLPKWRTLRDQLNRLPISHLDWKY